MPILTKTPAQPSVSIAVDTPNKALETIIRKIDRINEDLRAVEGVTSNKFANGKSVDYPEFSNMVWSPEPLSNLYGNEMYFFPVYQEPPPSIPDIQERASNAFRPHVCNVFAHVSKKTGEMLLEFDYNACEGFVNNCKNFRCIGKRRVEAVYSGPCNGKRSYAGKLISIFIDSRTYSELSTYVDRYANDIKNDLCSDVALHTDIGDSTTPQEIRGVLMDDYRNKNLIGAVFIGKIPYTSLETSAYTQLGISAEGSYPSSLYYRYLNGKFEDIDGNGAFDQFKLGADVWSGVLLPPQFESDREMGMSLLKQYFDRNHRYRTVGYPYDRKLLYFANSLITDFNASKERYLSSAREFRMYGGRWSSQEIVPVYADDGKSQTELFLNELKKPYEYVLIGAHGSPAYHDTGVTNTTIRDAKPNGLFYEFRSCSVGNVGYPDYLAGGYLFYGNGLAAFAAPVVIMTDFVSAEIVKNLNKGLIVGDAVKSDAILEILGDPTLRLMGRLPDADVVYDKAVELGTVRSMSADVIAKNLTIRNKGKDYLIFDSIGFEADDGIPISVWYPFYKTLGESPPLMLPPEESINVTLALSGKDVRGSSGTHDLVLVLRNNDPDEPIARIPVKVTID